MKTILLSAIAALGLFAASPAFADRAEAPEVVSAIAHNDATIQPARPGAAVKLMLAGEGSQGAQTTDNSPRQRSQA